MVAQVGPFRPARANCTVQLAVSGVPAAVQFDGLTYAGDGSMVRTGSVRIVNAGAQPAFIELTGDGQVNVVGGLPIMPGATVFLATQGAVTLAAVTAAGNTILYATPGDGGM